MKIADMRKEELAECAMVELAYLLMQEKNEAYEYYELINEVATLKGMSKTEVKERMSFLYTDLNIDGRFLTLGDNRWGLRSWYPLEQVEEEITSSVAKPKKKAKALALDEEDDLLDEDFEEDEFEDLEDELDELSQEEDEDEEEEEEEVFKDQDTDLDDFAEGDDEEETEEEE
ncbi:DNA-directed RNA polymerase subunit delta [Alkalihalobacillus alcalophilus ATCC 27647 = CGMCC 1.3604]|uniref:Probable DNA-directed RNA polymerase subunit delta n=1 Tax=Alkalihalobacillus alcalophilus ATCC 27647 = CGMCC 1.3604 TaxID=1218173 RepID=A0A094YRD1_ALKAL|nr:DNA-directed RNA polymerase subunit delta [Alkalihalobacillus alcalophilus ATCC 27647 = CGMCC 1.3604]MED1561015.1 DNA-directed RNA polymerase subunit delta [Alkalihalobacillus alcalophilus]THG89050.1 DNA-directed RNA polymerase subunit delta [Alkalihalobacillus alcalophilus ATCC 27647 = CGMCC 1.3604]